MGPVLGGGASLCLSRVDDRAGRMASLCVLMSVYWLFEPIPLAVTAMIPAALFPFYGASDVLGGSVDARASMRARSC